MSWRIMETEEDIKQKMIKKTRIIIITMPPIIVIIIIQCVQLTGFIFNRSELKDFVNKFNSLPSK